MKPTHAVHLSAFAVAALFLALPHAASAAVWSSPFEVSGWLPYWRSATSTTEALQHLDTFKEVNPFGYTVQSDGTLWDAAAISVEPWTTFRAAAKAKKIRYVPTIMWSNPEAIHDVLSNPKLRAKHIAMIVDEAKANDFDGIDIDYEGKYEKTRPYFTLFLKELYKAMGPKWVQCTVESRTPIADRYYGTTPPPDAGKYANDFAALNKYCDRVRFMTYANNEHMYDLLWTFNPQYGWDLASKYNITPGRNAGGELGFTYFPEGSALSLPRPQAAWPFNLAASAAAAMTTSGNTNMTYRMITWQDSQAIADKVALAKKLGIRGVAVFKIGGGEDQGMWS